MSKPNLLNDLAFKFVFGQDTKEANQALKGILEVFLNQKIHKVQVKNPELITTSEEMKNARLNLLVEFDDDTQVNLEMQAASTTDSIPFRAQYYLVRVHAEQDMRGKLYKHIKPTVVLFFCNFTINPRSSFENHFQYRLEDGYPLCSEKDPCRIIFIEMPKVNFNKPLNEMNTKERLIYYFTYCQDKDAIGG